MSNRPPFVDDEPDEPDDTDPDVACRHCGDVGPADEDHTCPCPNGDDCPDHPVLAPFVVSGPQHVHETPPGETVHVDPESPQTQQLVEVGHLTPAELWQPATTDIEQESE